MPEQNESLLNPGYKEEDSLFIFIVYDDGNSNEGKLVETYGILATDVTVDEGETSFTTTTVGGDLHIYCTGQKPVTLSFSGCVIPIPPNPQSQDNYDCDKNNDKKFREFYEKHRIGKEGNDPVKLSVGGNAYAGCLFGYSRKATTVPSHGDVFSFKFIGIKMDDK